MEFRAVVKKSGNWWIGWLVDLPGVNAQEKTKEELLTSLKAAADDILKTPYEPTKEEELVSIKV
jgi:predicted RNase H-like HicB family nuclease